MARTVRAILLPKYTTYAGAGTYRSPPISVVEYDSFELVAWRGALPSGATFEVLVEESVDRISWIGLASGDPGEHQELELSGTITRLWLRAKVLLGTTGDFPVATCWLSGLLVPRQG